MTAVLTRFITERDAARVEGLLGTYFQERHGRARAFGSDYESLWTSLARSAQGGKLLRPALVLGVHEQLGGTQANAAVEVAVAFELLHTAFLLHDDVIDRDLVRRGTRNLVGERLDEAQAAGISAAGSERWAQASAILGGDLLIHDAQSMIARLSVAETVRLELLDVLDDAVFASAAGELADVALSAGAARPDLANVLSMTTWKTAPYSFAAPMRAGAVLAGASPDTAQLLAQFGGLVGLAFQLRDDVLGLFGEESVTGKSVIGDAREGKMTAMMAFARQTPQWGDVHALLGADRLVGDAVTEQSISQLRVLVVECGALGYVEELIAATVSESLALLDEASLPAALRAELATLSHQASERAA